MTTAKKSDKPNILFIMADDIGWFNVSAYNLGVMGYRTPNIDRIAREGALFTDFYGQQSCTAGRAAFITGQSPIRTGLTKVGMPGATLGLSAEDPSVGQVLKHFGYATGQFGKNHLGDRNEHGWRIPCVIRWPGVIEAGRVINDICSLQDFIPTFAAANGEPNLVEKVKKGFAMGGKKFKVHLDGVNLLRCSGVQGHDDLGPGLAGRWPRPVRRCTRRPRRAPTAEQRRRTGAWPRRRGTRPGRRPDARRPTARHARDAAGVDGSAGGSVMPPTSRTTGTPTRRKTTRADRGFPAARSAGRRRSRRAASACPAGWRSRGPRSRAAPRPATAAAVSSRAPTDDPADTTTTSLVATASRSTAARRSRSSGTMPSRSGSPPASRTSAASARRACVAHLTGLERRGAGVDDLVAGRHDRHPRPRVDRAPRSRPRTRAGRGPVARRGDRRARGRRRAPRPRRDAPGHRPAPPVVRPRSCPASPPACTRP